jgi:hypothetical protein
MQASWESDLAAFLERLLAVQSRTLDVLMRKRQMILDADAPGLEAAGQEERELVESLQQCLDQREELLSRARQEGLPSDSVRSLTKALPGQGRKELLDQVRQATLRSRLLQHHSLTNWVLVQKTLIHLSQLLEIIATGGRLQPTYGKDQCAMPTGALVDRAV